MWEVSANSTGGANSTGSRTGVVADCAMIGFGARSMGMGGATLQRKGEELGLGTPRMRRCLGTARVAEKVPRRGCVPFEASQFSSQGTKQ